MQFKKIYIEITNICNFKCSFCFDTKRKSQFMTTTEFEKVISSIRPYTAYIYLHVLGEPLLHPQIDEIIDIAHNAGIKINITTNGSLLRKHFDASFWKKVRQVNISLHDAEENITDNKTDEYLNSVLKFTQKASRKSFINLRLWNGGVSSSNSFNDRCYSHIESFIGKDLKSHPHSGKDSGIKLANNVFLQPAPRFEWPDGETQRNNNIKTCYALRDHIAVLADGTVVPCCIDADANLKLGNIFEENLADILQSEKAERMRKGFLNNTITEQYCKTCGFRIRE